jgi:leader peptidase (prepilin peptidase) / N-methyltransferase
MDFLDYPISWGIIFSCFVSFAMAWGDRAYAAWFSEKRKIIDKKFLFTLSGKSLCDACFIPLKAKSLIPMLGYIFSGGQCPNCGHKVSIKYPLNEGLFFTFGYISFYHTKSLSCMIYYIAILIPFYYLIRTEFKHKIIPFEISVYAGVVSLSLAIYKVSAGQWDLWLVILPTLLWYSILHLMRILTRYKMGLGDVILCSFLLPGIAFPGNLFLPSIAAVSAIIFYLFIHKRNTGEKLAFGPFLYASTFITLPFR